MNKQQPMNAGRMRWLALDLATTTGWATSLEGAGIVSGFESYKSRRFEGGGMRFLNFRRWLDRMLDELGVIGWVAFEEVRGHKGTDAAHIYGGLLAVLGSWCEERGIPYQGVPVSEIKKHATGKGGSGKPAMIAAMRAKGHSPADDNEADALAIMYWMIDHATTRPADQRPALHSQPRRRVQLIS